MHSNIFRQTYSPLGYTKNYKLFGTLNATLSSIKRNEMKSYYLNKGQIFRRIHVLDIIIVVLYIPAILKLRKNTDLNILFRTLFEINLY